MAKINKQCEVCESKFDCYESSGKRFCSQQCQHIWQRKPLLPSSRYRKSLCEDCGVEVKYSSSLCPSCAKRGKRNPFYKDGSTPEIKNIRNSKMIKAWRKLVFARDYWECQGCGHHGGVLHAHHIKSFKEYPELRFELSNGVTLCELCHKQVHWGQPPERLYERIMEVINVRK